VPLRTRDVLQFRPALTRWVKVVLVWQALVIGGCVLYVAVLTSRHGHSVAWVAPPAGAVFGSALPLQLVAMAIARAARG
jgi:hypothetical protein